MSTCSLYNESELNHYGMCRTYKLSKDKSLMLTQYVTKEKLRAERAKALVKELEAAVMNREGYIEKLESIIAKTQLQINGITINRKRK